MYMYVSFADTQDSCGDIHFFFQQKKHLAPCLSDPEAEVDTCMYLHTRMYICVSTCVYSVHLHIDLKTLMHLHHEKKFLLPASPTHFRGKHAYVFTYTNVHMRIDLYTQCIVCVCVCVCIMISTAIHSCAYAYRHAHVPTYTYVHMRIETHTQRTI